MNAPIIAIVVGIVAGIFIGSRVARKSIGEEPIYGDTLAKTLHWLACVAFSGAFPSVLTEIIIGRQFWVGVALAFSFVIVSFIFLIAYALVENAPRTRALADDRGWTAEKARTSGL
jgi:hypothetical protein